jgi:mono/diheme cytochrome c family protein
MIERRTRATALLAVAALSATVACKLEPRTPELQYSANHAEIEKNSDLAADPAAQVKLAGALEFLFGTPREPRYLAKAEWLDDEFFPNSWGYDEVQGDEEAWARLVEGNRRAYRTQIAAIEAGDYDAVARPRNASDLWQDWLALREDLAGGNAEPAEGVRLFEEYYPRLSAAAEMYRVQCYHCHGAEGGGNGSTSPFLSPRPRDYRPGKFKFTALKEKARPRLSDLFRILSEGVYTTAMPSFRRFSDAQLYGLADYVRLLAIRGETEILLAADYNYDDGINFENVEETYDLVVERWRESPEKLIEVEEIPESTPQRVLHGQQLFLSEQGANCIKCHGALGRGDGVSAWEPGKEGVEYAKDEWGNEIAPRNLTLGVFRFGRRPIDLYRRIYAGINGTPMPEHFGMTITEGGEQRTLTEDDVWDLVFFVRSLSTKSAESPAEGGH